MKRNFLVVLLIGLFIPSSSSTFQERDSTTSEADKIEALMKTQADSWNRGDFEGFMSTYWKSEEMSFQSGNSRLYGWETLLNRYKTNYAGDNRGTLTFTALEIKILTEGYAFAIGRYNLMYDDRDPALGLFTLILKNLENGEWKIIHDHSSS